MPGELYVAGGEVQGQKTVLRRLIYQTVVDRRIVRGVVKMDAVWSRIESQPAIDGVIDPKGVGEKNELVLFGDALCPSGPAE